jgi:DNA methyltransferase 1-associated protein 1
MELTRKFELRWPVIHDRWFDFYHSEQGGENPVSRSVDDLQQRYYSVAAILSQIRISQEAAAEAEQLSAVIPDQTAPDAKEKTEALLLETAAAKALATSNLNNQPLMNTVGTGTSNKMFDAAYERERRSQLDHMWNRSKEEELEEIELRRELKAIEAQLRKLKKMGGHIIASSQTASTGASRLNSAASSRNPSRSVSPVPRANIADSPAVLDQSFASTAPIPMPQTPYLQSGRLAPPATGGAAGLNKTLLAKMDQTLSELKISLRPVPTKRVCDLYDSVRKDTLTLLTLKKMLMQKEGNLQSKRVKLSKLRGGDGHVPDEETLLGIIPPTPAPAAATTTGKGSKSKAGKSKASGGLKSKAAGQAKASGQRGASQKNKADDSGKADAKEGARKPKAAAKRKRKAEPKTQTAAILPGSGPAGAVTAPLAASPVASASAAKAGKAVTKSGGASAEPKPHGAKKRARKT